MSKNRKEIVEKINDAFTAGDTEGFLSHCSDDLMWTMVGDRTVKGKDAVRKFMAEMEGFEPPKFTVDSLMELGNTVVCYGDMSMKGEDGNVGKYSYCDIYDFTGDEVTGLRSFVVKHKEDAESAGTAAA